jgi:hypothetical protein
MELKSWFRVRWHYWRARFSNEARQILTLPVREQDVVDQVMFGLKRDSKLRRIIEEHEAKQDSASAGQEQT